MAKEEKGPIDLLRKIRAGVKGVGKGFKSGYSAEKTAQATLKAEKAKKLKQQETTAKRLKTRADNKAKKLEEEAAAKSKGGRKSKATTETKTTAPKTKTKKVTKKELATQQAKSERDIKIANRVLAGAGILGGAGIIGGALASRKKSYKAVEDPAFQKQIKQYDDSVKRAKYKQLGPVKFKKGGAKKRK